MALSKRLSRHGQNLLLLLALCASLAPRSSRADDREVVIQTPVIIDDAVLGDILVHSGEEPADAVFRFGEQHGMDGYQREAVLEHICQSVDCGRKEAVIWTTEVSMGDSFVGRFELLEGEEPADAAYDFVRAYNLTQGYRNAILSEACEVVTCTRVEAVVWRKSVNIDAKLVEIVVMEGEEPSDAIYNALEPHGISFADRQRLMGEAKKDNVAHSRDRALLLTQPIIIEEGAAEAVFEVYDDGREVIDALYDFAVEQGVNGDFDNISASIMPVVCQSLKCQRMVPIVWQSPNLSTANGNSMLGALAVLRNEEPIDAVDHFAQTHGLDVAYRENILRMVCEELPCTRTVPVVYRKDVNDERGNTLGSVEVLEGEELADAVHRFVYESKASLDPIALKNYFFQSSCGFPRLKCTRVYAYVFDRPMTREEGSAIGQLTIREDQEPADVIYEWSKTYDLDEDYVFRTIEAVCKEDGVRCNRNAPVVQSIPLNGPDGIAVGIFEVKLRQEPVDALYAFFSRHGLFDKKWDIKAVLSQLCDLPGIVCNRREAITFIDEDFVMGGKSIGPVTIWEDQEVIDVLYEKRMQFNLTVEDQMEMFTNICKRADVHCSRTKAVVYQLRDITKNDYERYGNETCQRKYAGVQFLSSFADSFLGGKVARLLKQEEAVIMIEHPLCGPSIMLAFFAMVNLILRLVARRSRRRIHIGQCIVIYACCFVLVCFIQTRFVEPVDNIDAAVHMHEGKLPDLYIFEGDEPADRILAWGKIAAKKHHPIVREPIHWEILDTVCAEADNVTCTRRRAWEAIDMGSLNLFGQAHNIEYMNPGVDPASRNVCEPIMDGEANSCLQESAKTLCWRLRPQPKGCIDDITKHMANQMDAYEKGRLDSKDTYRKLGIEMDAPSKELFKTMTDIARKRGMNISPLRRIDNGTTTYTKWDRHSTEAWAAVDTFNKIKDPESREWNDKPCEPMFGGALCAKTDKDGNMLIEM